MGSKLSQTPDAGSEKLPEPDSFHHPGVLPPSEERKEIVRKIRARTLSRASQTGGVIGLGLTFNSQPPMDLNSSEPSSSKELDSKGADDPKATGTTAQNTDKGDKAAESDDTAWMHSDDSEPKPSKKPKKKKPKKKATSATLTRSTDPDIADNEAKSSQYPTNSEVRDITSVDDIEEESGNIGEWSTVSKPKTKKKESEVKNISQASEAKGFPTKQEKRPESFKMSSKPQPKPVGTTDAKSTSKPIETTDAELKQEFQFHEEEFPSLGSQQTLLRQKPALHAAPSTQKSQSIPSTQASYNMSIAAESSSQEVPKQQGKPAPDTNRSQLPPVTTAVTPKSIERSSPTTEDLDTKVVHTLSPTDPAPKTELSTTTSNEKDQSSSVTMKSATGSAEHSGPETEELDTEILPGTSLADPTPAPEPSVSISDGNEDSDNDSFGSDVTAVAEDYGPSQSNSDPGHASQPIRGLTPTVAVESARENENDGIGEGNTTRLPDRRENENGGIGEGNATGLPDRRDDKPSKSPKDSTVKPSSTEVPHPLVESTKSSSTWVSNPGKITINDLDASELLAHQYPPPLTIHDHPDVNIFLHSDWIACAFCDSFIRENNGEVGESPCIPKNGPLICSRCGPCTLTRYCSRACLLNDLNKHWEKCASDSCGVFPLNWSRLPKRYQNQLPALGTWSQSYSNHHSKERNRQMIYIANLRNDEVPHVRKSYFDKLIKAGPSLEFQQVRFHIATSHGTWNQPQAPGDYFLFIDHQFIDERSRSEEIRHAEGPFRLLASKLLRRKISEGLCPTTALPLQLPGNQRVAFNRLINACFVTNNTMLVEYLWNWIRTEISGNARIQQWCQEYGFPSANLFMLWTHQFEKEFGLKVEKQLHMVGKVRPGVYHPFSDGWPTPWSGTLNVSSIHSLIYEHELYHPLLRAWRCYEPHNVLIPHNPWARFRGDGFPPMTRPSGELLLARAPQKLPWNNGWHGMPPFIWKNWLENKHIVQIREALERFVSRQENLIREAELPKKSTAKIPEATAEDLLTKKKGDESELKWVVLRDGKKMPPLTEMRSGLKSLYDEGGPGYHSKLDFQKKNKAKISSVKPVNPLSVDGAADSLNSGQKPLNTTESHNVPANISGVNIVTKEPVTASKHALNPTVPEFKSLSPTKTFAKIKTGTEGTSTKSAEKVEVGVQDKGQKEFTSTKSAETVGPKVPDKKEETSIMPADKAEVKVQDEDESKPVISAEKVEVKVSGEEGPSSVKLSEETTADNVVEKDTTHPTQLATSAEADKWLAKGGFSVPAAPTTPAESTSSSAPVLNSTDSALFSRWKTTVESYCGFIIEEMNSDKVRKSKIEKLREKLARAEREDQEAAQAGIARVAARSADIDAIKEEMAEKGSEKLKTIVKGLEDAEKAECDRMLAIEDAEARAKAEGEGASTTTATATGADAGGGGKGKGKGVNRGGRGGGKA